MSAKKGFWVIIALVLATNATALEFEWLPTQHLEGPIDSQCNGRTWNINTIVEKMDVPADMSVKVGNAHFGENNYYVFAAVWIYNSGKIAEGGHQTAKNEDSNDGEYAWTNLWEGKADKVEACRDGRGNGRYIVYVKSLPRKDNVTLADHEKLLGEAKDLIWPNYLEKAEIIFDTTAPVYMWIDSNKQIFACIDTDEDKNCDYKSAAICEGLGATWNGVWYNKIEGIFKGGRCCGAGDYDTVPCAFYSELTAVCGKNAQNEWKWVSAANGGQARTLACPTPIGILVEEHNFVTCGNMSGATALTNIVRYNDFSQKENKIRVKEHEFLCTPSTATITECVGDGNTMSEENLYKTTGFWINQTGIQFCSAEGKWITDLDREQETCIAARQKNTWPGIAWTGSKCCGDPADDNSAEIREVTYEDRWQDGWQGTAGGCINNTFIASGQFADTAETIINYKGEFYSCAQSRTLGPITTMAQPTCGTPLLNATLEGTKHHILCTPEEKWMFTNNTATTQPTSAAWSTSKGCCLSTQCWDGENCKEIGKTITVGDRGYRCAPN